MNIQAIQERLRDHIRSKIANRDFTGQELSRQAGIPQEHPVVGVIQLDESAVTVAACLKRRAFRILLVLEIRWVKSYFSDLSRFGDRRLINLMIDLDDDTAAAICWVQVDQLYKHFAGTNR